MREIYLDHAATTPLDCDVFDAMTPYFTQLYANADSPHRSGRRAASAVDLARDKIAKLINANANEVFFTSGGTESDNWALRGVAAATKRRHIVISAIEHPAVLSTANELKKQGFSVTLAPVDKYGVLDTDALKQLVTDDTALVAVMSANNEIGTLQPVARAAKIAHSKGALVLCDAVQTAGVLKTDVKALGVDLLSLSAHKFYGPKGIGALYVKRGTPIGKLISGGHQERAMRGGTTNVPAAVGMAAALEKASLHAEDNRAYVGSLRDRFAQRILSELPFARYNGHPTDRLPCNAHFTFEGVNGETLLFRLDLMGVYASAGSACSSGSLEPSHVLRAIGLTEAQAKSSVRFSFGKHNTAEEADFAADAVVLAVRALLGQNEERTVKND